MATKASETCVPLYKKISVEKGHDIEQPLRIGERQESSEI